MNRWWDDPQSCREALDLVTGSDPRAMGVVTLGFHGIAKGALVPLAGQTLVDPATLVSALDDMDTTDVADALAATLEDELGQLAALRFADNYVASMREDAKTATVRLSKALVAKGLPWPRAVLRSAEVAGVPLQGLGRYATLAATPGLDPLSVADHADRTLMEHAARRSLAVAKATVSKAEHQRERQGEREVLDWSEDEHPRDGIGRFAEKAKEAEAQVAVTTERRAARARRRERRAAREKRTTVQRTKTKDVQRTSVKEVQRTDQPAKPNSLRVDPIIRTEAKTPGLGSIPLVGNLGEVGPYGSANRPVRANQRAFMILVRTEEGEQWHPFAYDGSNIKRAAVRVAASERGVRGVQIYEFGPGGLPLFGSVDAVDSFVVSNGTKVDRYRPARPGFVVRPDELEIAVDGLNADGLTVNGESLTSDNVFNMEGERPEISHVSASIRKAEEEHQTNRERQRAPETWDEEEHPRDEVGRFAEKAAQMQATKQKRAKRQARRERRASREVQRTSTKDVQRTSVKEVQRVGVKEAARTKEGTLQRTKTRDVQRTPQKQKPREDAGSTSDLVSWFRPVGKYPSWSVIDGSQLESMGVRSDVYSRDKRLIDAFADQQAKQRVGELTGSEQYKLLRAYEMQDAKNAYGHNSTQLMNALATAKTMMAWHRTLTAVMKGARVPSTLGEYSPEAMLDATVARARVTMAMSVPAGERTIIDEEPNRARLAAAQPHQLGGLGSVERKSATEVYYVKGGQLLARHPYSTVPSLVRDGAQMVLSDKARATLQRVRVLTTPREEMLPQTEHELAKIMKEEQASASGKFTVDRALAVQAVLRRSGLVIGALPDKLRPALAEEVLAQGKTKTVRLDGTDVFRIFESK